MSRIVFLAIAMTAQAGTDNFDDTKPGPLPTHWDGNSTGAQTGDGAAKWSIDKDEAAPSKPHDLAQRGEAQYHESGAFRPAALGSLQRQGHPSWAGPPASRR